MTAILHKRVLAAPSEIYREITEFVGEEREGKSLVEFQQLIFNIFSKTIIKESVSSVIFLDEGVLFRAVDDNVITKKTKALFGPSKQDDEYYRDIALSHLFNEEAVSHLHHLISGLDKVGIVISSHLRLDRSTFQLREEIFAKREFSRYIIGKTEDLSSAFEDIHVSTAYTSRGKAVEINTWLKENPVIKKYVVIDDLDEGLSEAFNRRFIHVYKRLLLTASDVARARLAIIAR